jgi:flagellar hook-associated protein 3 FlgL
MARVPDVTTHRHLVDAVQSAGARLAQERLDIATGVRVHTTSDDVFAANRAMDGQNVLRRAEGLLKATDNVEFLAKAGDAALASVTDLLARARELVTRAGNDGTSSDESDQALATEVNHLLESLLEEANRRGLGGTYLFGGKTADTAPYTATRDAQGNITGVTASVGIEEPVSKPVGESVVTFPLTGPGVFADGGDLFQTLIALRDGLVAGDYAAVAAAQPSLEAIESHVATQYGKLGSFLRRISWAQDQLEEEKFAGELQRNRAMNTDLPEAVTSLSHHEALYQAALEMSARVSQLSLMRVL